MGVYADAIDQPDRRITRCRNLLAGLVPCVSIPTGALAEGLCSVAASRAGAHGPVTVEERPLAEIVVRLLGHFGPALVLPAIKSYQQC